MATEQMGARISEARRLQKLTQQQLADQIGVTKSTISRYESGSIRRVKFPVITAIADVLGLSPAWILGKEQERPERYLFDGIPIIEGLQGPFPATGRLFAVQVSEPGMCFERAERGDFLIVQRADAPPLETPCLLHTPEGFTVRPFEGSEAETLLGSVVGYYIPLSSQ